ncbi:MAG TPA: hypothetical protein EYG79_04950 [Rhodobacteraceae bacterium]|nr:hypothetical protein [Paracoccaceae bacterium]
MSQLSPEQEALKAGIEKSAGIWGAILGFVSGGIAYWALSGQSGAIQMGLATAIGVAVLLGIRTWRIKANASAATCAKCSATFSISRTDRTEKVLSTEQKETREAQPDHSTKVTTWLEEEIETTSTYTCAKCGDTEAKVSQHTRKKDEKEEIEPAPVKEKPAAKPAPEPGVTTSTKGKPKTEGGFFSDAIDHSKDKK